jgi:hypothetical protein
MPLDWDRMTSFGLLRVCSAAVLAAGSIGVAMPAAADNRCNVRYSATEVVFTSCAAEERACEARGFIYGTTRYAQCVAALAGHGMLERRRALGFRPATPPAGMRQTPPPSLAPNRQP